jgi:hypothetical protein
MSTTFEGNGPLMTGGSRFGVTAPYESSQEALSAMGDRAFLMRFAEPITAGKHDKTGATPPETTPHDGNDPSQEDYGNPDYEP